MEHIADRLKQLMAQQGLKQAHVSKRGGIPSNWLSLLLSGRIKKPSAKKLSALAKALGVETRTLVQGTDAESQLADATAEPQYAFCSNNQCPDTSTFTDAKTGKERLNRFFVPARARNGVKNEFCPTCGHPVLTNCIRCGHPIETQRTEFCTKCGRDPFHKEPRA